MNTKYFQVVAHYHALPEHIGQVTSLLRELAEASRNESANLSYDYFQSVDHPAHFVILERYASAAGFEAHRQQAHFRDIGRAQIMPLLERRDIETYEGTS